MHIFDFFRDIFSVFGAFSRFFGCKIGFRKSCLCKRNDKYEVWFCGFDDNTIFVHHKFVICSTGSCIGCWPEITEKLSPDTDFPLIVTLTKTLPKASSQSKISLLSPLVIGSKLTFSGWSVR